MLIPSKHSGYLAGRRIYPGGGGSSAPAPDPALVAAQVKSMGIQDDLLTKSMALFESELLPIQRDALKGTLEAAKMGSQATLEAARMSGQATLGAAQAAAAPLMKQAETADKLANKSIELTDYQLDQMKKNDERWWSVGVKQEDQLIADVNARSSQTYKDAQAGKALADVDQGFAAAQAEQNRIMAAQGVDQSGGAFAATQGAMTLQKALGKASAVSNTRTALDNQDLANKFQLYGGMKGMSGLGQTSAGLATGGINAGVGAVNAGTNALGVQMSAGRGVGGGGGGGGGGGSNYRDVFAGVNSIMGGYSSLGGMAGSMGSNATNMYNVQSRDAYQQSGDSTGAVMGGLGSMAMGAAALF